MYDGNKTGQIVEVGRRLEDSGLTLFALSLDRYWVGDNLGSCGYQGPLRGVVIISSSWPEVGV